MEEKKKYNKIHIILAALFVVTIIITVVIIKLDNKKGDSSESDKAAKYVCIEYSCPDGTTDDEAHEAALVMNKRILELYQDAEVNVHNGVIVAKIPVEHNPDIENVNSVLTDTAVLEILDENNYLLLQDGKNYQSIMDYRDIEYAVATVDSNSPTRDNIVQMKFYDDKVDDLADFTTANIGNCLYFVFGSKLVSAPRISSGIMDGKAVISGLESHDEAKRIADSIAIGTLGIEITYSRDYTK